FAQITDGLSNTLMIGEDVPKFNHHSCWFYTNGDYASGHAPLNFFPGRWGIASNADDWPKVISFKSQHPNLVQFAAADGSIHVLRENINHDTHRALCTRAQGETVSMPD